MRELHLPLRNCNTTPTRLATFIYIARSLFWGKFARMLDKKTTHLPNLDNLGADRLQSCTSRASLTASRLQTRSLRALRACPQRMQENYRGTTPKPPHQRTKPCDTLSPGTTESRQAGKRSAVPITSKMHNVLQCYGHGSTRIGFIASQR